MAVGIPLELITMLGSGLLSGAMTLWSQSLKARADSHNRMLKELSRRTAAAKDARETKNKTVQFTRRMIALTAVAAIVVWPKVVPVFWPEIGATVGYTEWNPGFWIFEGSESVTWKTVKGLVLTPLDTHLMSSIIGLYFGASVVKNS